MEKKKFIVIACRHCDRHNSSGIDETGLTEKGRKQAENLGKMLILAEKGLLKDVPTGTCPKTWMITDNMQCMQTRIIIQRTILGKISIPKDTELLLCNEMQCRMEICSMGFGNFYESQMGALAFITVEDNKIVKRVFFSPEDIEEIIEKANI